MRNALLNSLKWFENSGVMLPADGLWGVAERVAVISGNSAIEEMKREFHAWTIHDGYCIIEQRRADCNFETAYLYLLAFEVFGDKKYYDIAVNILDFLYFRSGLLNRSQKEYQPGSWNWSHIKRENCVFFDDEAWCVFFQLVIGETYPELETRYDMRHWALILADSLHAGAQKVMLEKFLTPDGHWVDYSKHWLGSLDLPHWGSLTCMALAKADKAANRKPAAFIRQYYDYLAPVAENFNPSEMAYATLGATAAYRYSQDPFFLEMAVKFGKLLTEKMQENGNLPAEHYEAPTGAHLVDTIYTAEHPINPLLMEKITHGHNHSKAHFKLSTGAYPTLQKVPQSLFIGACRPLGMSTIGVAYGPIVYYRHITYQHRQSFVKTTLRIVDKIAPYYGLLITEACTWHPLKGTYYLYSIVASMAHTIGHNHFAPLSRKLLGNKFHLGRVKPQYQPSR